MENQKGLPKDWEIVKLGKFVEYQKGKKPKKQSVIKSAEYHLPYVDIEAFEHGIIKSWTDGEGCRLCSDTDFLMVWDGSRSGLVGKGLKGALGSTLMRLNFPSMENQYAYYFLLSKYQEINTRAKGSGTPHVDPDLLWNYDFPIPPYDAQKLIVTKIEELFSELDSGIASLKTAQEQLKIYRQALLKHAFEGKLTEQWRKDNADQLETPEQLLARIQTERETRYQQQLEEWKQAVKDWEEKGKEGKKPSKPVLPKSSDVHANDAYQRIGGLPASWAWLKLSDLLQNSPQNGLYKPSSFYGLGCQIIRIDNFYDGRVTDKQSLKRLAVTDNEKDTYGLKLGDLIVNRVNSIEYLGKSALIRKLDEPIVFESNIMRCTLLSKTIEREFIVLYLNTIIGRKELCKNAKHAVNQASINQTDVGNSFLPICSLAEQQEIVNLLEEKLSIIERNEKEIEDSLIKAELLRQSILKKAFSGMLTNFDSNMEIPNEHK
ncbi:restriction endonuclease subunit S [Marinospirillum minutulum]|uniref:restriction endonuclease subunit S n=1 Tax=Marinospirillum minutulum TaxID=64974 RepID=UPI00041C66AF|nr:restriction endonuclease subunit S [Marinospirillum minutulum]